LVVFLLRRCGGQGDLIRVTLRSENMYPALVVDLNRGLRDNAKAVGCWHGNRHTLVTELAETAARQRAAGEARQKEADLHRRAEVVSQSAVLVQ
jgi:hypothetical protein